MQCSEDNESNEPAAASDFAAITKVTEAPKLRCLWYYFSKLLEAL
jgi:hypothetical protein